MVPLVTVIGVPPVVVMLWSHSVFPVADTAVRLTPLIVSVVGFPLLKVTSVPPLGMGDAIEFESVPVVSTVTTTPRAFVRVVPEENVRVRSPVRFFAGNWPHITVLLLLLIVRV